VSTEQEYDAQADMVDDQDSIEADGPGPFPQGFGAQMPPPGHLQQGHGGPQQRMPPQTGDNGPGFPSMTQLLDPYDPMLDMDPFGLSASMHFPTQFTFDTSSMR
jgi:hypothetical protein